MFLAIVDTSYETVRSRLADDGEVDHQFNDDVAFVVGFPRRLLKSAGRKFIEKLYAMTARHPRRSLAHVLEFVDMLARDTVAPAAMGKRGMQAQDAMGVADLDRAFLGHKVAPKAAKKFGA